MIRCPPVMLALVATLALLGCESDSDDDDSGIEHECVGPPQLQVTNETGNAFERLVFHGCDDMGTYQYPFPEPLADGETATVNLPEDGCWLIDYQGEGCFPDPPHTTSELECGDTYELTFTEATHVCAGG